MTEKDKTLKIAAMFEDKCRWNELKKRLLEKENYLNTLIKEYGEYDKFSFRLHLRLGSFKEIIELMEDLEKEKPEDWFTDE